MTKARGVRIPTPLVVSLGLSMVTVGVIAVVGSRLLAKGREDRREVTDDGGVTGPLAVQVDVESAAGAAETFLDAWRKHNHAVGLEVSAGNARDQVEDRQRREASLDPRDQEMQRVWNELAGSRLRVSVVSQESRPEDRLVLTTRARGTFLERPYEREFTFHVARTERGWVVEDMIPGAVLSEQPSILDVEPSRPDPSIFQPRGEDIP